MGSGRRGRRRTKKANMYRTRETLGTADDLSASDQRAVASHTLTGPHCTDKRSCGLGLRATAVTRPRQLTVKHRSSRAPRGGYNSFTTHAHAAFRRWNPLVHILCHS